MDSEFPDEDDEYEMRYADEFELMNELGNYFRQISRGEHTHPILTQQILMRVNPPYFLKGTM